MTFKPLTKLITLAIRSLGIVCLIVLAGCAAFNLGDANRLQKGQTKDQVLDVVSKGPSKTFEIKAPGDASRKLEVMSFVLKNAGTATEYFAVFEDNKLLYWGYPYEFNRHPDIRLNEIGRLAVEESQKQ